MDFRLVLYFAVGRLVIYLLQKSPYKRLVSLWVPADIRQSLYELFSCDLCLGWWVYLFLTVTMQEIWFTKEIGYIPALSEIITCSAASFLMWLLRNGWDSQFREVVFPAE